MLKNKLILTFTLLLSIGVSIMGQQVQQVTSTEVDKMLKSIKKFIVLDVRTADEFKSGHIKGAVNIDITSPDAVEKIKKLDRNANYIVHCRTKNRSQVAIDEMSANGFKNLFKMHDGIVGWKQNNLPTE